MTTVPTGPPPTRAPAGRRAGRTGPKRRAGRRRGTSGLLVMLVALLAAGMVLVRPTAAQATAAPVAVGDVATSNGGGVAIPVLANDTDADHDALTVLEVGPAAHGTTALRDNGTVIYVPTAGYVGPDGFSYTVGDLHGGTAAGMVQVRVTPTGAAPVAAPDTAMTTPGRPVVIDVLANDDDPDSQFLAIASVGPPVHGAAVRQLGKIVYTPQAGFVGSDLFTYLLSDGNGHLVSGHVTVLVAVRGVSVDITRQNLPWPSVGATGSIPDSRAAGASASLPNTGADLSQPLLLGSLLVAVGCCLVFAGSASGPRRPSCPRRP